MTSDELAHEVAQFTIRACARVTGTGAEQYDDGTGTQTFERLPLDDLFTWAQEELEDIVVYAVMASIRLDAVRKEVAHAAS